MSRQPFAEFLKLHHQATAEGLRVTLGDKGFLLVREPGQAPEIVTLERSSGGSIGAAADAACRLEGLAESHCEVRFHPGFASWVLHAPQPTGVGGTLAPKDRPLVLTSRDELRFPTTKARVQFYEAGALIERLRKAGATKRVKRVVDRRVEPAPPAPAAAAPASAETERPSRRLSRTAANGVSWGD